MDTSNSVAEYIKNGYKAPLNQLSSREWLAVIEVALDRISSILSYLPHIQDLYLALEKIVLWNLYKVDYSFQQPRLAWKAGERHWHIDEKIRLIPIGAVTIPASIPSDNGIGQMINKLTDVHLFISTKRQWIKLERILAKNRIGEVLYEEFLFCGLNDDDLIELVGENVVFWPRVLVYLNQLACVGINQKRLHIEKLEHVSECLTNMKSRVGSAS